MIREIGNIEIEEVTSTLLKDYLAKPSERLRPSSLGHRIRFIRCLFRYAFEKNYIVKNPILKLKEPKIDKRIPNSLINEAAIHLKIRCDLPRGHALLEFLFCAGCRVGEVQRLNIE